MVEKGGRIIVIKESPNLVNFENESMIEDVEELLKSYNISGRLFMRLLKSGNILVNNEVHRKRLVLKPNDRVSIFLEDEEIDQTPEEMAIDVIYEDEDILAVDKAPFIVVHPTSNIKEGTLSNGIANYFKSKGIKRKVRIVNRLDRDTSGIIIFAKNSFSHQQLAHQMESGEFSKYYLAIVEGKVKFKQLTIDSPIEKGADGIHQEVSSTGSKAITHIELIRTFEEYSLVKLKIDTGKTHQIRVHLKSIGHPIIGDILYGRESSLINRQALHAYKLVINQPRNKRALSIISKLPDDMKELVGDIDLM